ncbi:MAG: hypothetical protein WD669_00410 [Pirellulales bacterium]
MRHILLTVATVVILSVAGGAWSQSIEDGEKTIGQQQPSPAATSDKPDSAAPTQATGDSWRFKRHDGLWWYWLPSEKWVYWSGDGWVDYNPETYAQWQASRRARSYSYSSGSSWGPKRYNGYGQVEYPYSRRSRGIKQLGPVPAMGGVRSLPGWGGER